MKRNEVDPMLHLTKAFEISKPKRKISFNQFINMTQQGSILKLGQRSGSLAVADRARRETYLKNEIKLIEKQIKAEE